MEVSARTLLLLGLSEGPAFGLELMERVPSLTGGRFHLNRGGTYVALQKLEREGLVRAWRRATGDAGRPRVYYELTPRGIAELQETRQDLESLLHPGTSPPDASETKAMADRVTRCGNVSVLARSLRDAALRAGLR